MSERAMIKNRFNKMGIRFEFLNSFFVVCFSFFFHFFGVSVAVCRRRKPNRESSCSLVCLIDRIEMYAGAYVETWA